MSHFLEKLQSADEATKRRWMILSTIIIMVMVIYVWMAYFNNLVAGFSQAQQPSAGSSAGGFTFWQTMKNGTAILYRGLSGAFHSLGNILNSPREFIVKPPM